MGDRTCNKVVFTFYIQPPLVQESIKEPLVKYLVTVMNRTVLSNKYESVAKP